MLRPSRVLAISSLLGLTLVGCEQPTADRPGPVHAQLAAPATPIFYDNHDAFFQQFRGLPLEDFEEGKVADAGILVCPAPVDASNNNQCFSPPDDILPGVEFNSDHSIDLFGRGVLGNPSKNIVVSFGGDAFIIDFTGGNVTAAGMDLVSYSADMCQMDVFGQPDVSGTRPLLGSKTAPCTEQGAFLGVCSDEIITRIRIQAPILNLRFEGVDNIAFGPEVCAPVNHPPVANAGGPYSGAEGSPVLFNGGASTDPDVGDVLTYDWDFGDGTPHGTAVTGSHTYADNHSGGWPVTLKVTDQGGLTSTATATAAIANVAPTATFRTNRPVNEGSPIQLSLASPTDPSPVDVAAAFTYAFDCGSGYGPFSATPSATCPTDDNGTRMVRGQIRDKDGGTTEYTAQVTIDNVAPAVGAITAPLVPVPVTTPVTASASFTDPGVLDTHTGVFDWGDGKSDAALVTESNGSGSVSGTHEYTAGVYTVTLTVTDKDGGVGHSVFQFLVVYDPLAGFVTGGGWILSPPGAYTADPTLTGKATFGFVAAYQPGARVPSGNTEFQFHAADFNFHSTSYDWLVVSGPKAQYKGSGTINGAGDFGFRLTAVDDAINGSGGADKLRIQIFDKGTGVAIYDNQLNAGDGANPTTVLGGGQIIIHH